MRQYFLFVLSVAIATPAIAQSEFPDTVTACQLDEIIVEGERPEIDIHAGVMVVDLPGIIKDKPVTNILEALDYLPGVINTDGTIGLSGASSVSILLNGEPATMPLQNLYQLLYSTPVDRLKKVEIMYSAPAKYHVSGAVINIVMKTPRPIDGLMGQFMFGYNHVLDDSYSGALNATYAVRDWTFDFNWSLLRNQSCNRQKTFSNHLLNGSRQMIEDDMRQIGRNWSDLIHASVGWKNVKLSYNGQITSHIRNRSISTGTFGDYSNFYKGLSPTSFHNIATRYETPFGLTIGGDYTYYHENRCQNLFKDEEEKLYSENRQDINRYHAYMDQEHELDKWTVGYGFDYQHSADNSRQSYMIPDNPGFDNELKEDIANAYIGVQASFPWGLSFNTSVDIEYFHNDYQHNWNLIPQLGATYCKTTESIFQFNFTSQRIFPSYWELHGGTSFVNDYSRISGNPSLQPYVNYTGQFNYIFRQKYAATFYVLYADDYFVQLPYQSTQELRLVFKTMNMNYSRTVGLQLHIPFNIETIWDATGTLNISHVRQKSTHFHDLDFDNKRWSVYAAIDNTIRLTPTCPVSLSVDGSCIIGQIQGPGRFGPLWKIDAGVKWQFGKKHCCELIFKANDILNTCNPDLRINFSGQDYRMKGYWMNRSTNLTLVWRFNGFRPKENKLDISRFGTGN